MNQIESTKTFLANLIAQKEKWLHLVSLIDKIIETYKNEEMGNNIQQIIENKKELNFNNSPYKNRKKKYKYSGWKQKTMEGLSLCKNSTGTARDICAALSSEDPFNKKTFSRVSNALVSLKLDGNVIRLPNKKNAKYVYTITIPKTEN